MFENTKEKFLNQLGGKIGFGREWSKDLCKAGPLGPNEGHRKVPGHEAGHTMGLPHNEKPLEWLMSGKRWFSTGMKMTNTEKKNAKKSAGKLEKKQGR